jgi:hypothetical protein
MVMLFFNYIAYAILKNLRLYVADQRTINEQV